MTSSVLTRHGVAEEMYGRMRLKVENCESKKSRRLNSLLSSLGEFRVNQEAQSRYLTEGPRAFFPEPELYDLLQASL